MLYAIIVILLVLLVTCLAVIAWLMGELERIHRDSEQDWADPSAIWEVDEE